MECKAVDIMRLLEEVANKTGYKLLNAQFPLMYEKMKKDMGKDIFAEDYMYRKMFLKVRYVKDPQKIFKFKNECLEMIAGYLGYKHYHQFAETQEYEFPSELENCLGVWCSYVRCNSGNPEVYFSPIHVYRKAKQVLVEMKGFTRLFIGELKVEGGCLYCFLKSGQQKSIQVILKIGLSKKPYVLQGVFAGLSSNGDPIAGREVWVRNNDLFENMNSGKIKISELINSDSEEKVLIGEYFSDKQLNTLKAGQASTFELNDLKKK